MISKRCFLESRCFLLTSLAKVAMRLERTNCALTAGFALSSHLVYIRVDSDTISLIIIGAPYSSCCPGRRRFFAQRAHLSLIGPIEQRSGYRKSLISQSRALVLAERFLCFTAEGFLTSTLLLTAAFAGGAWSSLCTLLHSRLGSLF